MVQRDPFTHWLEAAEARYLADLTRPELGRALRALSSCYVERRGRLSEGHALAGKGKRAAFALYYAPLHFLTVREIARALTQPTQPDQPDQPIATCPNPTKPDQTRPNLSKPAPVFDVGCGTGAAGAAWALVTGAEVRGSDVNPWAVAEAAWTYRTLGLAGSARRGDVRSLRLPSQPSTLLAGFLVNELSPSDRGVVLDRLVEAADHGHRVVVVEPISRKLTPWWGEWERAFTPRGGRTEEWRFRLELPRLLRDLDKSAGLDHRELTARTLRT